MVQSNLSRVLAEDLMMKDCESQLQRKSKCHSEREPLKLKVV